MYVLLHGPVCVCVCVCVHVRSSDGVTLDSRSSQLQIDTDISSYEFIELDRVRTRCYTPYG